MTQVGHFDGGYFFFSTTCIFIYLYCIVEEWSGYVSDSSSQDETELNEAFYRRKYLEQYGPYVPYA